VCLWAGVPQKTLRAIQGNEGPLVWGAAGGLLRCCVARKPPPTSSQSPDSLFLTTEMTRLEAPSMETP